MPLQLIDAGMLRTRLVLEKRTNISDGQGGINDVWTEIANIYAHVEPKNAIWRDNASRSEARVSHRITIRYRQDIQIDQRFVRGGRFLEIRTIHDPDESHRYLICECEEIRP